MPTSDSRALVDDHSQKGHRWARNRLAVPRDDWNRHWDELAEAAAMNPAQLLRRRVVRSLLGLGGGRARVLDIGCGQGDLLEELCLRHPEAELCGMDHSGSGVGIARSKVPTASFLQWDLLQEAPPPARLRSWATHAVCSEVLEHIDDPEVLLQN